MKRKQIIIVVVVSFMLFSCFSYNKMLAEAEQQSLAYKESFKGKSSHELVQLQGPPNYKTSDENGGEIYVYERTYTAKKYENNILVDYLAKETKMFFINANDEVYNIVTKSEPLPENNQIIINTK